MAINFSSIHTTLKNSIDGNGFTYKTSAEWFNFEYESFPTTTLNSCYTIRPAKGKLSEEYQAEDWNESFWTVEFCMDGTSDAYLANLGTVHDEIQTLESLSNTNIVEIEFFNWDLINYNSHIIMTYEIKITLNE